MDNSLNSTQESVRDTHFSHMDESGNVQMVDVGAKALRWITLARATA